jgi:hypothetical protein
VLEGEYRRYISSAELEKSTCDTIPHFLNISITWSFPINILGNMIMN